MKRPANWVGGACLFAAFLFVGPGKSEGGQQPHADADLHPDDQYPHGTGQTQGQHATRDAVVVCLGLLAALPFA